jgi:uncharacterized protein (DUF2267 family)
MLRMDKVPSMKSRTVYLVLALVFASSLAVAAFPLLETAVRPVAAIPAAAAIVAAVFQLLRDHIAHDRTTLLHASQRDLAIGAASHMASVAFDKHVAFAEAYVAETLATLKTLFRTGPGEEALTHAAQLYELRQRSALWLTPDIDARLENFEAAVREIGAGAHFVETTSEHPRRRIVLDQIYRLFAEVTGMETWEDRPVSQERTTTAVVGFLRAVLGVQELTSLRKELVAPGKAP